MYTNVVTFVESVSVRDQMSRVRSATDGLLVFMLSMELSLSCAWIKTEFKIGFLPRSFLSSQWHLIFTFTCTCIHCDQKKNTHSHFLLYLRGKCLDLHKIFLECFVGNKYTINGKVRYSLLPVTSCCVMFPCLQIVGFTIEDRHLMKC